MSETDDWTSKEKFTLACCVARSGDQNWVSVSRNMRSVSEACGDKDKRLPDFFSQKNCAVRYSQLLGTALTSKRKSRSSNESANIETPAEQIYRKLTFANIEELNDTISRERVRFTKLKNDLLRIQSGDFDDQIVEMLKTIQSGHITHSNLQTLIPEEETSEEKVVSKEKGGEATKTPANSTSHATSSTSSITPSRPQRQPKETEKFKKYIEQRQKHNAKYQHHSNVTTPTSSTPTTTNSMVPSIPSESTQVTTTPTTSITTVSSLNKSNQLQPSVSTVNEPSSEITSNVVTITSTSITSTSANVSATTTLGPTPAQVQKMVTKVESITVNTSASTGGGLLTTKTTTNTSQQKKSPLVSPTTPVRKLESSSFLSSLLASPATEIKAQVTKITEELKEPLEKRDIHHVTEEAYSAYRKALPEPAVSKTSTAPVLSRLLETNDNLLKSSNTATKISPVSKISMTPKTQSRQTAKVDSPRKSTTQSNASLLKTVPTVSTTEAKNVSSAEKKETTSSAPVKSQNSLQQCTTTLTIESTSTATTFAVSTETKKQDDSKKTTAESKETPASVTVKDEKQENLLRQVSNKLAQEIAGKKVEQHRVTTTTPAEPTNKPEETAKLDPEEKVEEKARVENDEKAQEKQQELEQKDSSQPAPLPVDVGGTSVPKNEGADSESVAEPPLKKRAIDLSESTESLDSIVTPPSKGKKKGKGRQSRGGRKKTLSGTLMKIDIPTGENTPERPEDLDVDGGDVEEDLLERKKQPLTPYMCSSPASPALSSGSCDPETAQQLRAWRKSIMLVWKAAASHKYANVFLHPVTDEEAPGYSSIIFRPMDLSLIKKNIETGVISTATEFQRDIMLMFQNALMYNRKEHDVYRMAQEMRDDVMEQIQSFISTQLMLQTSGVERDSKVLRTKTAEVTGHTRQSSKSGVNFLSL